MANIGCGKCLKLFSINFNKFIISFYFAILKFLQASILTSENSNARPKWTGSHRGWFETILISAPICKFRFVTLDYSQIVAFIKCSEMEIREAC